MRKELRFEQRNILKEVTKTYYGTGFKLIMSTQLWCGKDFIFDFHISSPQYEATEKIPMVEKMKNNVMLYGIKHLWTDASYNRLWGFETEIVNEYADLINSHLCDFDEEKRWILNSSIWKTISQ